MGKAPERGGLDRQRPLTYRLAGRARGWAACSTDTSRQDTKPHFEEVVILLVAIFIITSCLPLSCSENLSREVIVTLRAFRFRLRRKCITPDFYDEITCQRRSLPTPTTPSAIRDSLAPHSLLVHPLCQSVQGSIFSGALH